MKGIKGQGGSNRGEDEEVEGEFLSVYNIEAGHKRSLELFEEISKDDLVVK